VQHHGAAVSREIANQDLAGYDAAAGVLRDDGSVAANRDLLARTGSLYDE